MNFDRKTPVALEDLLRLKRAERPAPEFWDEFDRELRVKQLAAIVEKRSSWTALLRFGPALRFPLGAAAAATVAWIGAGEFSAHRSAHEFDSPVADHVMGPAAVAIAPHIVSAPAPRERQTRTTETAQSPAYAASNQGPSALPEDITPAESLQTADSASQRPIAASFAVADASDAPGLSRDFAGLSQSYSSLVMTDHPRVTEPLASIASPSGERRSRLLGNGVPLRADSFGQVDARSSARTVSGLSDDRLNESVRRYGVDGSAVSINF